MKIPKLMLITNGKLETNPITLNKIFSACRNGLPAIQLREKTIEARRLSELAKMLRKITSDHGIFFSINDRLDIALSVDADAVHLSEGGLSPHIPKKLKPSLIVGVSVHSLEMGRRAEQEGADYVLFGPIFQTPSKIAFGKPQGLENLEKIAHKLSIPVLAVGGITPVELNGCINAGAYGVAAIGAFMQSEDIKMTINDFLREFK
jgi:thiamine-phosphate pyrophosphorylase